MRNLVLRNQIIFGTVNAGRDAFEAAVAGIGDYLARWPAAVRSIISGRHGFDAYRDLLLGRPDGIKQVLAIAA
jgi:hypothetical protein